ncbi:uncharacterized protein LOC127157199 [Labeo rohita]|uniref:uncharacterized protein LOC127157199 n=1 Tax=Labeo rohita TaxID=84645 RepID=UPI0021E2C7DF|nr:uncharacterized protein LOC127157199 [Labeo rohita]
MTEISLAPESAHDQGWTAHLPVPVISNISSQNSSSSGSSASKYSQIVLICASAAGSLLIVAAVGIFCICKKNRKTDQEVQTHTEITYTDQTFYKRGGGGLLQNCH